jgi:hypothetical protein
MNVGFAGPGCSVSACSIRGSTLPPNGDRPLPSVVTLTDSMTSPLAPAASARGVAPAMFSAARSCMRPPPA